MNEDKIIEKIVDFLVKQTFIAEKDKVAYRAIVGAALKFMYYENDCPLFPTFDEHNLTGCAFIYANEVAKYINKVIHGNRKFIEDYEPFIENIIVECQKEEFLKQLEKKHEDSGV